jgi:hypothetical protein
MFEILKSKFHNVLHSCGVQVTLSNDPYRVRHLSKCLITQLSLIEKEASEMITELED